MAEAPAPASVFIDTNPLGARIQLDGRLLTEETPALLRGLGSGKHTVSLWKDQFGQVTQTFVVSEGRVAQVDADLPPDSIVLAFPENTQVTDGQESRETKGDQFRYPKGTYTFSLDQETLRLTPIFPDEPLVSLAGWSLAFLAAGATAMTVSDAYHIQTNWTNHPSSLTIGLLSATILDAAWFAALQGRKARFLKETVGTTSPLPSQIDSPQPTFDAGEASLQTGGLAKAEELFTRVVREYPTSQLVPGAWFRLARIHSVTGRRDLALAEYRLVAETYPQAAYYDRARQALANLYEAAGKPADALESLNLMVLNDNFFDKADIEAQKARLSAQETTNAP
jgi:hypothetical protein